MRRTAVSTIIGTVIVLALFLTVGYGYFYTVAQNDQLAIKAGLQNSLNQAQQNEEYLVVTGTLVGPAVGFVVNNSGIAAVISSYFITDSSTGQLYFNSGTSSNPILPYAIGQGQSVTFTTNLFYTPGHHYVIKLLTQRGSSFVSTYPGKQLSTNVASALVAAGIGSVAMVFSSYNFYNLTGSGSNWQVGVTHPRSAALLPYGVTPAFSMQVTNNDPSVGTITINAHTEIYLYETCRIGCGGNVPIFAFFVVNVASNGTVTSTSKGSFVPITVPYGATQTLYFASANDLSLNSFASQTLSGSKVGLGEYDVFLIVSGSDTLSTSSVLYSQNLPFAGSYLADNVAWFSETPTNCTHSAVNSFTLTLTNSWLSPGGISQVYLNASGLSSVTATNPSGWKNTISGTAITWTPNSNSQRIAAGTSLPFTWGATAPSTVGTQTVFTISITFSTGKVLLQQAAVGCYVV